MLFTNVKEFCTKTGFPERTLKRYIKEGKLPYHKAGRVYILDYDKTLECLEHLSMQNVDNAKNCRRRRKKMSSRSLEEDIDYLKRLK